MDWSWLFDILRSILFWLDTVIYGFIGDVYEVLNEIANVTIFSNDTINAISNKVYALLGIFMLFKVSFSILSYVVSPDDFYDKNKGFGKIISNIVITLAILVVTPWIFNKAMEIQDVILRDNIIGNMLLTSEKDTQILNNFESGKNMAFTTLSAFLKVDESLCGYSPSDGKQIYLEKCANENGEGPLGDYTGVYRTAYENKNIRILANNSGIINIKTADKSGYVIDYNYVISTLSGGFILLILILFCFDVGVRTVKLGFLRLIAPIPIISRIDPKKGKEVFDKYVNTCISTYLDLFVRLLSINLAVFVISVLQVGVYDVSNPDQTVKISMLAMVFIILGTLLFAKQFPQLLQDILGIKFDGNFTLNPMRKLGAVPVVGGALAAGATLAGGAALAAGRGLANSAGGLTKKAAGHVMSEAGKKYGNDKLSKAGSQLSASGSKTLANTTAAMQKRWDNTRAEARGRFQASGFAGGEYKGDTAHQMYAKEREKLRNERRDGLERSRTLEREISEGRRYSDMAPEAIYHSEFLSSKEHVDRTKTLMYAWQNEASKAQSNYQVAASKYGVNSKEAKEAYEALEKANKNYGSASGQYEYSKKQHEAIRKVYAEDARIEDSIEAYEKYDGGKPIPNPKDSAYEPGKYTITDKSENRNVDSKKVKIQTRRENNNNQSSTAENRKMDSKKVKIQLQARKKEDVNSKNDSE